MTVRARLDDEPTTVPEAGWEYTSNDGNAIRLLPDGAPFKQSFIYEFMYTAKDPRVSGIGLAATRDFVSFLRNGGNGEDNPLSGDVEYAFSYSISQPARTLNDFQALGINEDDNTATASSTAYLAMLAVAAETRSTSGLASRAGPSATAGTTCIRKGSSRLLIRC